MLRPNSFASRNKKLMQTLLYLTLSAHAAPLCGTVFTVTTTADNLTSPPAGSLRASMISANTTSGPNSIVFNVAGTIALAASLPPIESSLTTIDASGNAITINGSNQFQAFFSAPNGTVTIENSGGSGGITLLNTASVGGTGGIGHGGGGGGALGAGGGLFVAGGSSISIQGVSFSGCSAVGGTGGATTGVHNTGGGGGGGMNGGNGGNATTFGGGGGGGYGGVGGTAGQDTGGGGGGLFFTGGTGGPINSGGPLGGGGGGASDVANGGNGTTSQGGNGANGSTGTGGTGGTSGVAGGAGTGTSGGGGGGPASGAGGNASLGAGGGGAGTIANETGGIGGNSTGSFGGGGGGGTGVAGGTGGNFGGGGGGGGNGTGVGGAGGFGGGGGGGGGVASATGGNGGKGGFGAGGGGSGGDFNTQGGTSVFGGGTGGAANGLIGSGGGGAGLGGAIFIQNTGTLTIGNPNVSPMFQGSTVTAGAAGAAGGSGVAGTAGQALGQDIFLMSGGTIIFDNSTTPITVSSAIVSDNGAGGGSTLSGGIAMSGSGTTTLSANNTFTGGVTVNGTGTLTLNGTNTYPGVTMLVSGILQISSPSSVGSDAIHLEGGKLELLSSFGNNTLSNTFDVFSSGGNITSDVPAGDTVTLSGAVNAINLGGTVSVNQTAASTLIFSEGIFGQNSLTVNGIGTVVLAGVGSYSGATSILGGTLRVDSPFAFPTGNVLDNSHLLFNISGSTPLPVGVVVSGTGDVTMEGTGLVKMMNASNSYSGGTNFNAGTIAAFDSGSLGTGTLTFNGGTLEISGAFLTSQPVTLNASGGTVQVDNGTLGVLAGPITGTGGLTTQGPGVLFLGGTDSATGPTTVQSGTLIVEAGASITASSTTVQIATLVVNGTVSSPLLVDFGGTLMGTGTVSNATIDGIISPGVNSIGTINGGTVVLNGSSSYFLQLSNTTADLIAATGPVTINGGSLRLFPTNFTSPQNSYTIITASSVVNNAPFILINPLTRYNFSVVYDPTDVRLVMQGTPIPFHDLVTHGNAGAVAKCFDVLIADNSSADVMNVLQILNVQTPSQIAHSLNQMQPANFNNVFLAEENVAERVRQIYSDHFFEQRAINCEEAEPWRVWAAPFVERVRQHGREDLPGYLERFSGFSAATDYRWKKHWMLTGGFSYASTEVKVPQGRTSAHFKTYSLSVGGAWTAWGLFGDAIFSYLFSDIQARRKMHFSVDNFAMNSTVNLTAKHHDNSNQVLGHIGLGYDFKIKAMLGGTVNIYPFANIDYLYLPQGGYTERGAGGFDLKVHSKRYDFLRPEGGIGIGYRGCFETVEVLFNVSASYIHEIRYLGEKTSARFKPVDCTFTVTGLKPENNLVSPNVRLRLSSPVNGFSLALGYHGEYGSHFILNAGEAELRKSF